MSRLKKVGATVGATLMLLVGAFLGTAVPANAVPSSTPPVTTTSVDLVMHPDTVSGTLTGDVQCVYQNYSNVVGVYVTPNVGVNAFASWTSDGNGGAFWSFPLSQSASSYSLHIGCGGTPSNWAYSYSINLTTNGTYVYCADFDGCVLG